MFTLVIVGRPNVGKSTLFNRLAGKKLAIVDDRPGVTRDWREAEGNLLGYPIRLIDTAGLEDSFDESMQGRMRKQTESALKQADAVLFLVDGRAGITPLDEHFANWLRKQKIPIVLGVNKCESDKAVHSALAEAHGLGLGDPVPLSAEHGEGLRDLYDMLKPHFPPEEKENEEGKLDDNYVVPDLDELEGREDFDFAAIPDEATSPENPIKLAIVGRPNVGKSTLMNTLIGEERVMVGAEAGTTRDAIAVRWTYKDRGFRLVDTAGLRRKARVIDPIEKMATEDSMRAIRLAQVVVLVLDANNPVEKQDLTIAQHVAEEGRALVIAINKWDTVKDKTKTMEDIEYRLRHSLAQLDGLPVVTMSALNGKNLDKLMDEALRIYGLWNARISTAKLNRWLAVTESRHPAPAAQGRPNRMKYMTQVKTRPPTFAVWMSRPADLPDEYKRYLINALREEFELPGVPVRLLVRASKNPYV